MFCKPSGLFTIVGLSTHLPQILKGLKPSDTSMVVLLTKKSDKKNKKELAFVDCLFLDYMIITTGYYSFADEGMILGILKHNVAFFCKLVMSKKLEF